MIDQTFAEVYGTRALFWQRKFSVKFSSFYSIMLIVVSSGNPDSGFLTLTLVSVLIAFAINSYWVIIEYTELNYEISKSHIESRSMKKGWNFFLEPWNGTSNVRRTGFGFIHIVSCLCVLLVPSLFVITPVCQIYKMRLTRALRRPKRHIHTQWRRQTVLTKFYSSFVGDRSCPNEHWWALIIDTLSGSEIN